MNNTQNSRNRPIAKNYEEIEAARGTGQLESVENYLRNDPISYYQRKFKDNPYYRDDFWSEAAKKGEIEELINLLQKTTDDKFDSSVYNKVSAYNDRVDYDSYMMSLAAPHYDDTTLKMRKDEESGVEYGEFTDKGWAQEILNHSTGRWDAEIIEQRKKERSFLASLGIELGVRIGGHASNMAGGIYKFVGDLWNVGEGLLNMFFDWSSEEGAETRFLRAFDDQSISDNPIGHLGEFYTNLSYEVRRQYSVNVNAVKAYEAGYRVGEGNWLESVAEASNAGEGQSTWGRWTNAASQAIGYMLPTIALAAVTGGASAPMSIGANGIAASGSAAATLNTARSFIFYTAMFGGDLKNTVNYARSNGLSYKDLDAGKVIANSALKAAAQYGIEKALGAIIGYSGLDKMLGMAGKTLTTGGTKTITDATKSGFKAAAPVIGRLVKDAAKEGLEETLQDLSDLTINWAFGESFREEALKNFSLQNLSDAFIVGAMSSIIMGATSDALTYKPMASYKKDGTLMKLGYFQTLNLNQAIAKMSEWTETANNTNTSLDQRIDSIGKLNMSFSILGDTFVSMGKERAIIADTIVKSIAKYSEKTQRLKAVNTATAYSNMLLKSFIDNNNEYTKAYFEKARSKVKSAIEDKTDKLQKAGIEKLETIITEAVDSKDPNLGLTEDTINTLKKALAKFGVEVLVGVDGAIVTKSGDVLFVDYKLLQKADMENIIKGLAYDTAVETVLKNLNSSQKKLLERAILKFDNKATLEDAVYALLFDKTFYTYVLLTSADGTLSKGKTYKQDAFDILATIDTLVNTAIVSKLDSIPTQAYKVLMEKIRNTMRVGIVTFATQYENIDLDKVSLAILPAELKQVIRNHRNVIFTTLINNSLRDKNNVPLPLDRVKKLDDLLNTFVGYLPVDKIESLKKSIRSAKYNERLDALVKIGYLIKFEGQVPNKLVYLPAEASGALEQIAIQELNEVLGVNYISFIDGTANASKLAQIVKDFKQIGKYDLTIKAGRIALVREILYHKSGKQLTIGIDGQPLKVISKTEFGKPAYLDPTGEQELYKLIKAGNVTVQDISAITLDPSIGRLKLVWDSTLTNKTGRYLDGDNKISLSAATGDLWDTILHELTHATQYYARLGITTDTLNVAGGTFNMFNILPNKVQKDLTEYLKTNFPQTYDYLSNKLRPSNLSEIGILYFMLEGELQAFADFTVMLFETGFTWKSKGDNHRAILVSPDGTREWSMQVSSRKTKGVSSITEASKRAATYDDTGKKVAPDIAEKYKNTKLQDEENNLITMYKVNDSFIGPAADLSSRENSKYSKALELDKEKKTPAEIYKATGWFKLQDGKFRYEISNADMKLNLTNIYINLLSKDYDAETLNEPSQTLSLDEVIDHKTLFKHYPYLKTITVKLVDGILDMNDATNSPDFTGAYNPNKNCIYLNSYPLNTNNQKRLENNLKAFKRTIIHEIQHAIQYYEGFAIGGNSDWIDPWMRATLKAYLSEHSDKYKNLVDRIAKAKRNLLDPYLRYGALDQIYSLSEQLNQFIDKFIDKYKLPTATNLYNSLLGELEAYEVAARTAYTSKDLKARPLALDRFLDNPVIVGTTSSELISSLVQFLNNILYDKDFVAKFKKDSKYSVTEYSFNQQKDYSPAYVKLEKPFITFNPEHIEAIKNNPIFKEAIKSTKNIGSDNLNFPKLLLREDFRKGLIDLGYDGILFEDKVVRLGQDTGTEDYNQSHTPIALEQTENASEKLVRARHFSSKFANQSNLKYWNKTTLQADPRVQDFVIETTGENFYKLPEVIQSKILDGTLDMHDMTLFIATSGNTNDYTFRTIAKHIYQNPELAEINYKQMIELAGNLAEFAMVYDILAELDEEIVDKTMSPDQLLKLVISINELAEKREQSGDRSLSEKLLKARQSQYYNDTLDDVDYAQSPPLFFNHYDGTLKGLNDIYKLLKVLLDHQKVKSPTSKSDGKSLDMVDIDTIEEEDVVGGKTVTNNWVAKRQSANIDYEYTNDSEIGLVLDSIERLDKIEAVVNNSVEVIIGKYKNLPKDELNERREEITEELDLETTRIHNLEMDELNQEFLNVKGDSLLGVTISTKPKDSRIVEGDIRRVTPAQVNTKNLLRQRARTVTARIDRYQSRYEALPELVKNNIDPTTYKLTDAYKTMTDDELQELSSALSSAMKELRVIIKGSQYYKIAQTKLQERLKKLADRETKAKERLKQIKDKTKTIKAKINKPFKLTITGKHFSFKSRIEPSGIVQALLNTEWSKTRNSTLTLGDTIEQNVHSGKEFFDKNSEILLAMDTQDAEGVASWFMEATIADTEGTSPEAQAFEAIRLYVLGHIYSQTASNKLWESFNPNLKQKLVTVLDRLKTKYGTGLAVWNNIQGLIHPLETMVNAEMNIAGIPITTEEKNSLAEAIASNQYSKVQEAIDRIIQRISEQKLPKKDILRKISTLRSMSMLSGPLTWVRNYNSNFILKRLNNWSSKIANAILPKSKELNQLKMTGEITPEIQGYIENQFIDTGLLDLLVDNLSKYNPSDVKAKFKDATGKPSRDAILAQLVIKAMYNKYYNTNMFGNKALDGFHKFLMKMLSDNNYVREAAVRYFGKILAEHKYKLSETNQDGQSIFLEPTDDITNDFASALGLALSDYMHSDNIFTKVENVLAEHSEPLLFIYKLLLPFAKAQWNWFKAIIRFNPIGLAQSIIKLSNLENEIIKAENAWASGKLPIHPKLTEFMLRRNFGAGVIGTVAMILGMVLARLGYVELEDEDFGVPKLRIGNLRLDISALFGSSSILAGMALTKSWQKEKNLLYSLDAALEPVLDGFFLTQILELDKYSYDGFATTTKNFGEQLILSFIPNMVRYASNLTYTGTYQTNNLFQKAISRIPFFNTAFEGLGVLNKKTNPYTGDYNGTLWDVFNRMIPYIDVRTTSMLENESRALGITKLQLRGNYEVNGKPFKLDSEQVAELNMTYGQWNADALTMFYSSQSRHKVLTKDGTYKTLSYIQMDETQRRNTVQSIFAKNAEYAKILAWLKLGNSYYASETEYLNLKKLKVTGKLYKGNRGFVSKS